MFRKLAVSSVFSVALMLTGVGTAAAQAPAPAPADPAAAAVAAPAVATPESAKAYLGEWTLSAAGDNGPGTFVLNVKVDAGKVVGEMSSDVMPLTPITDISTSDKNLILKYGFDYQGMAVPVVVTLKPAAEKIGVQIDFADGAYQMTGTATQKKP